MTRDSNRRDFQLGAAIGIGYWDAAAGACKRQNAAIGPRVSTS